MRNTARTTLALLAAGSALATGLVAAPARAQAQAAAAAPTVAVTLTADHTTVLLGTKIRLSGTADPGAQVDIYVQPDRSPGGFLLATSVTANADGAFAVGTTPQKITSYRAGANGPRVDVTTTTKVTAKAKALGGGKVQFTVNGKPSRTGFINVYEDGARLAHLKSDKYGDGAVVVQSTPGRRTFLVGFQVTGSDVGTTSITGTVR